VIVVDCDLAGIEVNSLLLETANLAPANPSDQFQQEQRSEPIVGCPDQVPSASEQSQTCTGDLRLAQRGSSSFMNRKRREP
jgi:hypothetical protein